MAEIALYSDYLWPWCFNGAVPYENLRQAVQAALGDRPDASG